MKTTQRLELSLFLMVILSGILISACSKDNNGTLEPAVITGYDMRYCVCCGGWFIEIGDSTWRFYTLPAGSDIDLQRETLPLHVRVAWEKHDPPCLGDEIDIKQIVRQ